MSEEREARILSATRELLLHYGYDKTTVSDIARAAGISKGAIYLHFNSKEQIIHALVTREIYHYSRNVMQRLQASDPQKWSFGLLYQIVLEVLVGEELLKAITRNDRRIFGSYLTKEGAEWINFKQQNRYPLLIAMQQAGAIRADVDAKAVDYILSLLAQGLAYGEVTIPQEHQVATETFIHAMGDMMDRWLMPEDGGNREAGRQIILNMIAAFNAQTQQDGVTQKKE